MGTETKIQWVDHTLSPWHGCTHKIMADGSEHPGCRNCYAEGMARRNPKTLGQWGEHGTRIIDKTFHQQCRKWNAAALAAGVRQSVFPSICDPFEDFGDQPVFDHRGITKLKDELQRATMDDLRRELFDTIDDCPALDFILLTKRPENVRRMWPDYSFHACVTGDCPHNLKSECDPNTKFRDNVWLLTSVSDQRTADEMVPDLLKCRDLVPVLGLSVEPLLGPINLFPKCPPASRPWLRDDRINWVIVGGESGPKARPCNTGWIEVIIAQCRAANVACFVKQLGTRPVLNQPVLPEWPPYAFWQADEGGEAFRLHNLNDSKGGDWTEWPDYLRVREYPAVPAGV